MKQMFKDMGSCPADKLSGRVLMVIIALSAAVFAAFYLVGYDMPFEEDASFNAPLLTDVLLVFTYLLLAVAVVVSVVAVAKGVKVRDAGDKVANGIPASLIAYGTVALLVVSLVVTFALGSSEPMKINGETFAETFWLKLTDMFIYTSAILMAVAVCAVAYGLSGRNRNVKLNKKE